MWQEITDGQRIERLYTRMLGQSITLDRLDRFGDEQQFQLDIAMWYGFLAKVPNQAEKQWKLDAVRRVFTVLYRGGLMVKRDNGWKKWNSVGGPVASVISHTAKVTIFDTHSITFFIYQ